MKLCLIACLSVAVCDVSLPAMADDTVVLEQGTVVEAPAPILQNEGVYHPSTEPSPSHHKLAFGVSADVGFPSGIGIGVVASPYLPWLKLGLGYNNNVFGQGMSGRITLDPFNSPVGLTLTGEAGGFWSFTVPVNNSPDISYTYESALLGAEFGNRSHLRFFLRGGVAHIDANVSNFQHAFTLPNGSVVGNPNANLVAPAAKIGIDWLF